MGASRDEHAIFEDAAGEALVISDALFRSSKGEIKVKKRGRHPFILLLARALRDPDEIWVRIEPKYDEPGRYLTRRRYITRGRLGKEGRYGLSVFQWGRDGWTGVTTFVSEDGRYVEDQRDGVRIYLRQ